MSRLLKLRVTGGVNAASKRLTLLQIVELLEKCEIIPRGNLTNTSKKALLVNSLKSADDVAVEKFLAQIDARLPIEQDGSKKEVDLHKDFRGTKVEKFLKSGDYEEAVRVAYVRINNRVKRISGLGIDGAALMRSAFSKNSPRIKINLLQTQEERDEQEGIMHILEGCMLAFRNPQSHDDEKKITSSEAARVLGLANYLMTVLDQAAIEAV